MPITIKKSSMKYKDSNGNMQDVGLPIGEVETDSTLTKSGVSADAKAVGDKIEELEEYVINNTGEPDLTGYATETYVKNYAQPKGNYLTQHQDLSSYAKKTDVENMSVNNVAYGTCSSAAADTTKVVTLVGVEDWKLEVGKVVLVYFDTSNSASSVKINVNGTGAYPIWYNNAEYTSTGTAYTGYAKRVINYMFNGTYWVWIGSSYDANSTYKNVTLGHGYATCATAEATTAKVGTLSSYTLTLGGITAVKFTNAVPANSTLNINSKGAKNIFFKGAQITANVIKAGDIATFIYDGTQYQLLSIDRWQNDIESLQNDKADKSSIPTKTSQLTNDSNFLTQHQSLSGYAKTVDHYTKTESDNKYQPKGNYLTQHQDLSGYIPKAQGADNVGKILMVDAFGNLVLADLPTGGMTGDVVGVVSSDNTIVLTGALPEGVYTIKYESEDGELQEIGTINLESETVVPLNLKFGKIDYANGGTIVTSDTYLYSDLIDVGNYQYYASFVGEGCSSSVKIVYYDANGNYTGISDTDVFGNSNEFKVGSWGIPLPSSVAKFRLRMHHGSNANANYSLSNMVLTRRRIKYTNVLLNAGYVNDSIPTNYPHTFTATTGYFTTGLFPYTIADVIARVPIYIKGVNIDFSVNLDGKIRILLSTTTTTTEWMGSLAITDMSAIDQCTITKLGEGYYVLIPNSNMRTANGWNAKDMQYMKLSLPGTGAGVIVTVNEPIE